MTKFFTVSQNNSQGVFDNVPEKGIGYALCVEANDANHAVERMESIVSNYDQGPYCSCCGERWGFYLWDGHGTDTPELYGEPLRGGCGMASYTHYLDGRIEATEVVAR